MVVVTQYLRYSPAGIFGIICSNRSNIALVKSSPHVIVAVGACEHVHLYDLNLLMLIRTFDFDRSEVLVIRQLYNSTRLAVGYKSGSIFLFNADENDRPPDDKNELSLVGHKASISCLCFNYDGTMLASGSEDNDIVIWDLMSESGLCKLHGHKDTVTQVVFMENCSVLVSSSKDRTVKFWDVEIRHCFYTIPIYSSEVWGMVLMANSFLVTSDSTSKLKVFKLDFKEKREIQDIPTSVDFSVEAAFTIADTMNPLVIKQFGEISKSLSHGLNVLISDQTSSVFLSQSSEKAIDVFKCRTEEEAALHLKKKLKKLKKKIRAGKIAEDAMKTPELEADDVFVKLASIKLNSKMTSADIWIDGSFCKVCISCKNNQIHLAELFLNESNQQVECVKSFTHLGHSTYVRAIAIADDETMIATGSSTCLKIWNRRCLECFRTIPSEFITCMMFMPYNKHILAGTKHGKLQIFDLVYGAVTDEIAAHSGPINSLSLFSDKIGFVSGSSDKILKVWDFVEVMDKNVSISHYSCEEVRKTTFDGEILAVKLSPNNKYVAVALMDSTVKVLFADTFKLSLTLYGHSAPVSSIDISFDSELIITGSGDRTVKIWGLDFGDCHRSLVFHEKSVVSVAFVDKTHHFFSASKDNTVARWDGDTFERIQSLKNGHFSDILCMAVSSRFVVTASKDKSIRIWNKTEEILSIEVERQEEREEALENEEKNEREEFVIPGDQNTEASNPALRTSECLKGADRIIEALDVYAEDLKNRAKYKRTVENGENEVEPPVPMMAQVYGAKSSEEFVMASFEKIKSSELDGVLLLLPFFHVRNALKIVTHFLELGRSIELCARIGVFLVRRHHYQIICIDSMKPEIECLRNIMLQRLRELKNCVAFNIAALGFLKQKIENRSGIHLFENARKRKKQVKRVVLRGKKLD